MRHRHSPGKGIAMRTATRLVLLFLQLAATGFIGRSPRPPSRRRAVRPLALATDKVRLTVDLGRDGEPKGTQNVAFTPLLSRSQFVIEHLNVPLGMNIELLDDGAVQVTGSLPGYSAADAVLPGDLVRGLSAYKMVIGGAPMWQQVMSYTPRGKLELKRLFFRTEGATFEDVRDAIASHKEDGANKTVILVLERPVDEKGEPTPRDEGPAALEPLSDIILRDLKKSPIQGGIDEELDKQSVPERARRLLSPDDDIFKRNL